MNNLIEEGKRVLSEEINSLMRVKDKLDLNFANAVIMIANAHKLVISGVGKSGMIARKIAATFSSIGISAAYLDPVDALHGDLGFVQENDVVILLSKSGSTSEIVKLIPYLRARNSRIIAITGNMNSYLALNSDIALDGSVSNEACPYNLAPTSSALVALALGDALAMTLIKYKKITLEDISRLHPLGQIGRNFQLSVKNIMHTNSALPLIKLDESFKDAVIEITNKKIGCVCVVDDNGNLRGIITDGDVRRVLQKYDDIRGLKVNDVMTENPVVISPDANLAEALSLMERRESQINVLPVVNERNKCIGVVRIHDIILSGV